MSLERQMPRYKSHKTVWALQIKEVRRLSSDAFGSTWIVIPVEDGYEPVTVSSYYIQKHQPEAGGYLVQYADGYQSYSPQKAFEEGNTRMDSENSKTEAPNKVTHSQILGKIKATDYVLMPDGRTTVCQLTMENGFTVLGFSACVDKANYDPAIGEKVALEDAQSKVWPYEGYLLAETLHKNRG